MIDLRVLRADPERVRASQTARGDYPALVDALLAADEARRSAIQKADELRSEQKAFGKKIGQAAPEDRPALLEGSNELKARVKEAEAEEAAGQVQSLVDQAQALENDLETRYRAELAEQRRKEEAARRARAAELARQRAAAEAARRAQQAATRLLQAAETGPLTALRDLVEHEHAALTAAHRRTTAPLP